MSPPPWLVGVDRLRCKWLNLKSATKMFYRETVMPTAEQCNAYAAEYRLLVQQVDVSIRRAATLMAISQSWTLLADQLERLADITKEESNLRWLRWRPQTIQSRFCQTTARTPGI